jgi:hypothetical protein
MRTMLPDQVIQRLRTLLRFSAALMVVVGSARNNAGMLLARPY